MRGVTTRIWYIDRSGNATNWGTAVSGGKATVDILRLVEGATQGGTATLTRTIFRTTGALVSNAQKAAAIAETSADPLPIVNDATRDEKTSTKVRRGISAAGGEFGTNNVPGTYGTDWHFDGQASMDFLASRGLGLIRVPFLWERIQPVLGGALDAPAMAQLTGFVSRIGAAGMHCVLDCHNYAGFGGVKLGQPGGPTGAHLADLWTRLSAVFKTNQTVVGYGLMNEPANIPTQFTSAQTRYSFDVDTETWGVDGSTSGTTVTQGTSIKHDGAGALIGTKDFTTGNGQTFRLSDKRGSTTHDYRITGNSTLAAWVMVPVGSPGTGHQAKIEVQDSGFTYRAGSTVNLTPGVWTQVTFTDTANYLASARAIVVQFSANFSGSGTLTCYVDSVQQGNAVAGVDLWKAASQQCVTAIRALNDPTCITVAGYSFSGIQNWTANHGPTGWITDPLNNFRYEGHHYWDTDHSGQYNDSYASVNSASSASGTSRGDAITTRTLNELDAWIAWLNANGAKGYLGEFGWPWNTGTNAADYAAWNTLAEKWFKIVDAAGLWATVWATGEFWSSTYRLLVYRKSGSNLAIPSDQAAIVEKYSGGSVVLTPYYKPATGIPSSDLATAVQTSLGKADTAYQLPGSGVPSSDMSSAVQTLLTAAGTAYQKPGGGVPKSDLSAAVQSSLDSADLSALHTFADGTDGTMGRNDPTGTSSLSGSGQVKLTYFTARQSGTYTKIRTIGVSAGSGGTVTLAKMAIYSIAGNGDLTLLAVTANDTTLWAAANTAYERATTASFNLVKGTRYAFAAVQIGNTSMPALSGKSISGSSAGQAELGATPRLAGNVSGQTDIPNSIAAGSISNAGSVQYFVAVP